MPPPLMAMLGSVRRGTPAASTTAKATTSAKTIAAIAHPYRFIPTSSCRSAHRGMQRNRVDASRIDSAQACRLGQGMMAPENRHEDHRPFGQEVQGGSTEGEGKVLRAALGSAGPWHNGAGSHPRRAAARSRLDRQRLLAPFQASGMVTKKVEHTGAHARLLLQHQLDQGGGDLRRWLPRAHGPSLGGAQKRVGERGQHHGQQPQQGWSRHRGDRRGCALPRDLGTVRSGSRAEPASRYGWSWSSPHQCSGAKKPALSVLHGSRGRGGRAGVLSREGGSHREAT